jgi:hypothetical protein
MKIKKYNEIMALPLKETEFWIKPIIPKNTIGIIAAPPKQLKSLFVMACALDIANSKSKKFLDEFDIEHGVVVIIDMENSLNLNHRRLVKFKQTEETMDLDLYFISIDDQLVRIYTKDESVVYQKDCIELISFLEKNIKPDLIIIDSLIRIHDTDENSASEMNKVYLQFKEIQRKLNCSIIILHHKNKLNKSMRGSSDILAMVDWHYDLKEIKTNIYQLTVMNTREKKLIAGFIFEVKDVDDNTRLNFEFKRYLEFGETNKSKITKVGGCVNGILKYLKTNGDDTFYRRDIKDFTGANDNTINNALKKLLKDEIIGKVDDRGKYKYLP